LKPLPLSISKLKVLQLISDKITIDILTAISNNVNNPRNLRQVLDLSERQYYDRISGLMNMGLVHRKSGKVFITSFGQIVYKAQLKIAIAFTHSSDLRMIDLIKSHSGISEVQQQSLIDKILVDSEIMILITPLGL
jgi:predicted transcriptional regulator